MLKNKSMKTSKLYVIKRGGLQFLVAMTVLNIFISDGRQEEVHFDKIKPHHI